MALVHLPLTDTGESCVRLAEEVKGLDLIVAGHSHVTLDQGLVVNDTYIVQAGEHGENLGIVNIALRRGVPEIINASLYAPQWTGAELRVDEVVHAVLEETNKEMDQLLSQVIGWTDVSMEKGSMCAEGKPTWGSWWLKPCVPLQGPMGQL